MRCKVGNQYFDNWTTNSEGFVNTETKMEAGKYQLKEIKIPNGFIELEQELFFNVDNRNKTLEYDSDWDAWITVTAENLQPTGTLIIDKSVIARDDVDTSLVDFSDLSKIQFKLDAKEDIIDMADGSVIYNAGQTVGIYSLSREGDLTINELPMGVYELYECKTLDGLVLDDTKYEVKFTQKDTVTKVYTETKEIVNYTTLVEISKTDITQEKELEGAKLSVIDSNGEIVDSWISGKDTHKIEGLKVGQKYILREDLTPLGFVKATDIEFTVQNTKEIQKVQMIDKIVEMSKINFSGEELEGAKIQVFDKDGNVIDEWISSKEAHKINNLTEGESYTLHEEIAIEGYVKASDVTFTVSYDKETQKVEVIDKIVSMTKRDISGNEIEGAEMSVTNENGEVVDSWTSTKEAHHISGLEENKKYVLHELYAPEGYVVATDVEFTVTTDKATQTVEMVDKIVEMSKVNINGEELEGATIVVTNVKTKNIVDKWVSEKTPHRIQGLIEGERYILHEEIAIDGYVKATDIEFEVTADKETQIVNMIDKILLISKTDLVTGEELPGAELTVTDEDGNIIDTWISSKEPHQVTGLEEGKEYTLTEVTCPYRI